MLKYIKKKMQTKEEMQNFLNLAFLNRKQKKPKKEKVPILIGTLQYLKMVIIAKLESKK